MPNYVKTHLTFNGSKEDIQKIKDLVKTERNEETQWFDFEKIIPYPSKENCPKCYLIDESKNEVTDYGISNKEAHISVIEDYPYLNWYDFNRNEWGTKWNACDTNWGDNDVWFDTAWSFCEPIVRKIGQLFPNVLIEFEFADEDIGSNCDYGWCKGDFLTYADISGEAAVHFAMKLWGDEEFFDFVDGEWKYIDC